ncbi:ADP-ribosylglycohydrolase family protein [Mycolicibacterium murale]|uniref:ADP-ribosylglycohydrolase family protein n=1 Tax=Mycolicibacterium murale TaxID=182220 RepID=UPI0021F343FF|nr:ADP-ribosylglycohydrolase family protein [Mycolicibacterium murale]
MRWLHTQGMSPVGGVGVGEPFEGGEPGWLQGNSELHASRNASATCISALTQMQGLGAPAENNSKGCSAVTRISPVGLFAAEMRGVDDQMVFRYGSDLAGLTDGHPTAKLAAGAFAVLIFRLARGENLDGALSIVKRSLEPHREHGELMHAIEAAEQAGRSGERAVDAIPNLGRGWVAHETLAIGIFCAMAAVSFADGVVMAVNHDGDSDSTGAITGSILGAALGVDDIPGSWLQPLELRNVIAEIADDLYEYRQCALTTTAGATTRLNTSGESTRGSSSSASIACAKAAKYKAIVRTRADVRKRIL